MRKLITSFFILKSLRKFHICGLIFVFLIVFVVPINALSVFAANTDEINEIIVKFKDRNELEIVQIEPGQSRERIIDEYSAKPEVEIAEPNYKYKSSIIPSDVYFSNQWYLNKIKAPAAWDIVRESPEIIIAIIDTGIQTNHPDLEQNIWMNEGEIAGNNRDDDKNGYADDIHGWDFVDNVADPNPKFKDEYTVDGIQHGTIVAGVAAGYGNNGTGITGVTWQAKIMPLRVLNNVGEGDTRNVIQAIDYAITNGADIINFSFVGFGYSRLLEDAIRRAHDAGIVLVAAAGNDQDSGKGYNIDETPIYPACLDGDAGENMVIGVSATDVLDQKASFSSFGSKCIDIAAPGMSIYSTVVYSPKNNVNGVIFNKYYDGYWAGTSMATPIVSGAVALIETINPTLSPDKIQNIIKISSDSISKLNPEYVGLLGSGRLNIAGAAKDAKSLLNGKELKLVVAPQSNSSANVKIISPNNTIANKFTAYSEDFKGGANVASGDIDGDGIDEIIVGAGNGGGPHVRIFNNEGILIGQFFAYGKDFRGGVMVASGDIDGNGTDEIIAGAGVGGGPQVRIFRANGTVISQFFAYDKNFRGGINVAAGDINGNGKEEIIAGAGSGGGPQVRIFTSSGEMLEQFFAYDENFRGGVRVASANMNRGAEGSRTEIITAPGEGGGPHIKIFNSYGEQINQFFAFHRNFRGGVQISSIDLDHDGLDEIIAGAGPGGAPHVRIFNRNGSLIQSFYVFEDDFKGGVSVSSIKL